MVKRRRLGWWRLKRRPLHPGTEDWFTTDVRAVGVRWDRVDQDVDKYGIERGYSVGNKSNINIQIIIRVDKCRD